MLRYTAVLPGVNHGLQPLKPAVGCRFDGIGTDPSFVCERVCTSDRLSRRMGGLSKVHEAFLPFDHSTDQSISLFDLLQDPVPNMCGFKSLQANANQFDCPAATDACTEACQKTVCTNMQQVPAWNDSCLQRCTAECLRGRSF